MNYMFYLNILLPLYNREEHTNLILKTLLEHSCSVLLSERRELGFHGGRSVQFSGILFLWQCALKIQFRAALCDKGDKVRAAQTALESD
jgi:hypothetical protein